MFFATLALLLLDGAACNRDPHMQRTEVLEAEEFFAKGRKAHPHAAQAQSGVERKRHGLARLVRHGDPGHGKCRALHERDISHSSSSDDRADATVTLDFALARLTQVIESSLSIRQYEKNLDRLAALFIRSGPSRLTSGVSREEAYALVQRNAMPVWRGEGDF